MDNISCFKLYFFLSRWTLLTKLFIERSCSDQEGRETFVKVPASVVGSEGLQVGVAPEWSLMNGWNFARRKRGEGVSGRGTFLMKAWW